MNAVLDDSGQGLAEYGVLLGFIAVLCVTMVSFLGASIAARYQNIGTLYP